MKTQPDQNSADARRVCCRGLEKNWVVIFGMVLLLLKPGLLHCQPDAIAANPANAPDDTNVLTPNSPEPRINSLDSIAQRGSYNFSDMGSWIWGAVTRDRQTCRFWKAFEIPDGDRVVRARLRLTGDNEYVLYLDGHELGRDAEWRHLYEYDITPLLSPGRHILAVEVYNSSREAGLMLGLRIGLAYHRVVEVKSDSSWVVGADDVAGWEDVKDWEKMSSAPASWPNATVIAPWGGAPWGKLDYIDIVPPLAPIVVPFWQEGWFEITVLAVLGMLLTVTLWILSQLALRTKEQRLLQRERARIARDIHDDIGMRMTQLVLQGEVVQSDFEFPAGSELRNHLVQICEDARDTLRAMDEILWAINPRRDNLREFATYVCGYAQKFLKATSIQCVLDVETEMPVASFDLPLRRNLLLAVKETLNNAAKHSHATELTLSIRLRGQELVVMVEDNGRGFEPALASLERNGLTNLNQRMNELGGRCQLTSQPGRGCRVELTMPLLNMRRHLAWLDWFYWFPRPDDSPVKKSPATNPPSPELGAKTT
jgi:two-component sensor histidine kinase